MGRWIVNEWRRERAKERKREGERTVISGEFVKTDGSKIFHFIIIIYGWWQFWYGEWVVLHLLLTNPMNPAVDLFFLLFYFVVVVIIGVMRAHVDFLFKTKDHIYSINERQIKNWNKRTPKFFVIKVCLFFGVRTTWESFTFFERKKHNNVHSFE